MDDFGNAQRWPSFRAACTGEQILAGCWYTDGAGIADCPADAGFVIAELESEDDYRGCIAAIGHIPPIPRAVLTNFTPLADASGYFPEKAKPLIEAGFACLTEVYLGDNPSGTPEQMNYAAVQCGWPTSQPCFGVYNYPLSGYEQWMSGGWSVYLAENVI